ncbi:Hypothetical_protein [Hexamita inflata]|uniref:Hypothetical_protein n=1 Tax=Hexamita inflata TaxID=28002 RepID=A0AA86UR05_9EUKA|nr:Hypothetical protein HINF_LOCUS48992 [Hexamita inflata]
MKRVGTSGFPARKYNTTKKSALQRAFNSAKQLLKLVEFAYFETVYSCFQQKCIHANHKQILLHSGGFAELIKLFETNSTWASQNFGHRFRVSVALYLSQILALRQKQAGSNGRAAAEAENTQRFKY